MAGGEGVKWYAYVIGGGLLLGIAFGWYRSEMAAAEWRGRVALITENYDSLQADFDAYRVQAAAQLLQLDSVLRARNAALDSSLTELAVVRVSANRFRDNWENVLAQASEEGISDSTASAIGATVAALELETEVCSLALKNCTQVIEAHEDKDREQGALLNRTQAQLDVANNTVAALREERPGKNWLPWAIVAVETLLLVGAITLGG